MQPKCQSVLHAKRSLIINWIPLKPAVANTKWNNCLYHVTSDAFPIALELIKEKLRLD